jgi:hypothetical protein
MRERERDERRETERVRELNVSVREREEKSEVVNGRSERNKIEWTGKDTKERHENCSVFRKNIRSVICPVIL